MGPQRRVKFRGGAPPAPPTWSYQASDIRAYDKFERKVRIWQLQAKHYMTESEIGVALFNSLKGEAEAELEFMSIESLRC